MKVAFHIHNDNCTSVDFSHIEDGNPGVGGSLNSHVLIPTVLQKRGIVECVLLCNKEGRFDDAIKQEIVVNSRGALAYCDSHKDIDLIVFDAKCVTTDDIEAFPSVKVILWSHNFISFRILRRLGKLNNVLRIVNVGREYNDLYRDMPVFNKSTYIFNSFNLAAISPYQRNLPSFETRPHHVVYIGSLIPVKGFHLLARAWQMVKRSVPDAELFVIGGGNLYNRNSKLGRWGIADEKYEEEFIPYLLEEGKIRKDVHFLGVLGPEKYEVFKHCRVGVANPSGLSETFGNGAVEMQLMGCNVTTIKCCGYLDSVYNNNKLYSNTKYLADYIIRLMDGEADPYSDVYRYIESNFSLEKIIEKWEHLFLSDLCKSIEVQLLGNDDLNYHNKKLKEWIRLHIPEKIREYFVPIEWFYPSPFVKIAYRLRKVVVV